MPVLAWTYPTSSVAVPKRVLAGRPRWLGLFLLSPLLLMAADGLTARRVHHGLVAALAVLRVKLPASLVRGMAGWIGYLPVTVLAAFLFSLPRTNDTVAPLAPSLIGAIGLTGTTYPVAFGGIGG